MPWFEVVSGSGQWGQVPVTTVISTISYQFVLTLFGFMVVTGTCPHWPPRLSKYNFKFGMVGYDIV